MKGITSFAVILLAVSGAPLLAQDVAVQVKEQKAGLLAQATIKPDSAQKIALASMPGAKVSGFEIEEEHGRLVYELKLAGQDGEREVYVDAKTGEIVTFEHEEHEAKDAGMGAGIHEEEPGLLAQATVKPDSAERIALASVPGGQIVKREIENEDGKLVYEFEITVAGMTDKKVVLVDAKTGALVEAKKE
jgi:uncharacterized membrane protein YkoI